MQSFFADPINAFVALVTFIGTAIGIVVFVANSPDTLWKFRHFHLIRRDPTVGTRETPEEPWERATRELAQGVTGHWATEAKWRGLSEDQARIRVTWAIDRRRHRITRRLSANPEDMQKVEAWENRHPTVDMLADFYWEMRPDALVVLGSARSGKSASTVLMTLGLLKLRSEDDPVPVHFSLSRWDRNIEFDKWLNEQVLTDIPGLRAEVYGPDAGLLLLKHDRIIPVLDGLDELHPEDQSGIIAAIAKSPVSGVIVTCRDENYEAIEETGEALPGRVIVVRLADVEPGNAIEYLKSFLAGTSDLYLAKWEPLFELIEHEPESPLAKAFRSPLNLAIVPKVYKRRDIDPGELLRVPPDGIEEHLLSRFVPAVYDDVLGTPGGRWASGDARHWLANLAAMTVKEQQIGWWELSKQGRPLTAIAAGLFAAATAGLAVGLSVKMLFNPGAGFVFGGLAAIGLGIWSAVGDPLVPKEIEVGLTDRKTSMFVSFLLIGGIVFVIGTGSAT